MLVHDDKSPSAWSGAVQNQFLTVVHARRVAVTVAGHAHQRGWRDITALRAVIVNAVLDGAEAWCLIAEVAVTHRAFADGEHM